MSLVSLFKTTKGILSKITPGEAVVYNTELINIPTYDRFGLVRNWEDLLGGHILFVGDQRDLNESTHEVSTNIVKHYKTQCEDKVKRLKMKPEGYRISDGFSLLRERNKFIVDAMNRYAIISWIV